MTPFPRFEPKTRRDCRDLILDYLNRRASALEASASAAQRTTDERDKLRFAAEVLRDTIGQISNAVAIEPNTHERYQNRTFTKL